MEDGRTERQAEGWRDGQTERHGRLSAIEFQFNLQPPRGKCQGCEKFYSIFLCAALT